MYIYVPCCPFSDLGNPSQKCVLDLISLIIVCKSLGVKRRNNNDIVFYVILYLYLLLCSVNCIWYSTSLQNRGWWRPLPPHRPLPASPAEIERMSNDTIWEQCDTRKCNGHNNARHPLGNLHHHFIELLWPVTDIVDYAISWLSPTDLFKWIVQENW